MVSYDQVMKACEVYEPYVQELASFNGMREALETYEQSKRVKFDINDKSTHPKGDTHVIVRYHSGRLGHDSWSEFLRRWVLVVCKECVTHWMPLPEFKE